MLEVRLLGKFEIRVDGRPIEMSLRAAQALLAYLLLNAGREQRREQVAGLLWPDMTDAKARDNLRHTLWVIRKALGNRDYLLTDDLSVSFNTALDYWLDTAPLESKTTGEESADDLIAIVAAYGGGLLPGFYDDWVVLERERLQAAFERKMGLLLEKLVEARRWPEVLEWGEKWIALGHVPEPAYRALMSAHAGLGDMASVASMYQRCVEALKSELGVELAAQTRALYERLQREAKKHVGDVTLEVKAPRHNLPAPLTSFIGREADVAKVRGYLSQTDIRLVTLIGPPGIGKTRLSIAAARSMLADFPDGVFFVALDPLEDSSLVAPTVVHTLGLVETDRKSPDERLAEGIGDKQLLLVLDNVEHIVDDIAPLVAELLSTCPRLKILTTSREALRMSGEWLYPVPTLNVPTADQVPSIAPEAIADYAALALFAERARAVRPDFDLNVDNLQTVAAICAQLDGLPLAIELIAARLRLMSPQALWQRLGAPFALLADGVRAATDRQRTLQGAIAWSYDLLPAEGQHFFARLAVFSGGFTLGAAEAIFSRTATDRLVPDLVASLVDKSLLQRSLDREARSEPRFAMLVTIQQFALDRLRHRGEEAEVRNWHLAYYLDLAEQADQEIHGPHQVEWLDRLEKETDNFRAALDWCIATQETEMALHLLGALGWPWVVKGHGSDLRSWFGKLRALPEVGAYPAWYGGLLNQIGRASWLVSDFRDARAVLEESRAIWLTLGVAGETGLAEALCNLGMVARSSDGDLQAAQSLFEQSLELYQKHGNRWGAAFVLHNLGINALDRNDDALALSLCEQSWNLFQQIGDAWGLGRASQWLGKLFLKQGNYEQARPLFEQHLRIDEGLHFKQGTTIALHNLGDLYRYQGDYDQAAHFYEKSLVLSREYGARDDWGYSTYALGILALHRDDYALARRRFIDYFDLTSSLFPKISACDLLTGLAAVAAGMNQPKRAARLYGAAQALFETTEYRLPPFDRAEFDRHIQIAREQLGEERFEAWQAEGRALPLEQATAEALSNEREKLP